MNLHFLIHSYSLPGKMDLESINPFSIIFEQSWHIDARSYLKILFIDECSLLTCRGIGIISDLMKKMMVNAKPFGGVRIILIGDVLQLPPIIREDKLLDQRKYFFQSDLFCCSDLFHVYYLKKVFRQKNNDLVEILNRIRIGKQTQDDIDFINQNCGKNIGIGMLARVKDCLVKLFKSEMCSFDETTRCNTIRKLE